MTHSEINAAAQAICKIALEHSHSPYEGMHILCAACYAFWLQNKNKGFAYEDWLEQMTTAFDELHQMNTTKGNA